MKEPVITLTLEEYEELRKEHECLEKEHAELQRKYEASLQEYSRQVEEISACTAVIADLRWKFIFYSSNLRELFEDTIFKIILHTVFPCFHRLLYN